MQLNIHPAPGLRALMPGWSSVPNNPVSAAVTPITKTPGIADIIPAMYSVPQNPVRDYVNGQVKMIGQTGCGCAGNCGCNTNGTINGMSGFSEDWTGLTTSLGAGDFGTAIQAPILGVPAWGWLAGIAALVMFSGGKGRRR